MPVRTFAAAGRCTRKGPPPPQLQCQAVLSSWAATLCDARHYADSEQMWYQASGQSNTLRGITYINHTTWPCLMLGISGWLRNGFSPFTRQLITNVVVMCGIT